MSAAGSRCTSCGTALPLVLAYPLCPCGGVPSLAAVRDPGPPSSIAGTTLWRYRAAFPLPDRLAPVTLGESAVPLQPLALPGVRPGVFALRDDLLPTGSWKDRGSTFLIAAMAAHGYTDLIEDSSGNAALSLARYAQVAGISFTAFVPAAATAVKKELIREAGATLVEVPGPRSETTKAAQRAAIEGRAWAAHALQPLHAAGAATAAFDIVETLGRFPGAVVMPAGQGGYLAGVAAGFEAMSRTRGVPMPRLIGVQSMNCRPLVRAFDDKREHSASWTEPLGSSLAEGVQIVAPRRDREAIAAVQRSGGAFVAVTELALERAVRLAWREGLRIEPTAGLGLAFLLDANTRMLAGVEDVVVLLSGHGVRNGRALIDGL